MRSRSHRLARATRGRQHWSAGGMRRKQADAWDQSWRSDSSQRELEHLRNMVVTLQRRCLRSGIPASVIPGLVQAKNAWQKMKAETPEQLGPPMRCALFSCLVITSWQACQRREKEDDHDQVGLDGRGRIPHHKVGFQA